MRRCQVGCLAGLLVLLALPAAAHANATVSAATATVTFTGTGAVDDFTMGFDTVSPFRSRWTWNSGETMTPDTTGGGTANCQDDSAGQGKAISCQARGSFLVATGEGNDSVDISDNGHSGTTNMGDGDDNVRIESVTPQQIINGGNGNDTIDDRGFNSDTVNGDEGNDTFMSLRNSDVVDGGPGDDTFSFALGIAPGGDVHASLDGGANDGVGAQTANLVNIENLIGGAENDTFTGSSAPNTLDGGLGDDHLDGGLGADTLIGGDGNDTIAARDGVADIVDCGPGTSDVATVDAVDTVTNCETVQLPAASGSGGGSGPVPVIPATPPPTARPCTVPNLVGHSLKADRKKVKRSGCVLGRVNGERTKTAKVTKQSPKPGRVLAAGSKVSVKLG
jgi:Ca2+-binding RTX toxin-like protein